jgi:hypothetical protein
MYFHQGLKNLDIQKMIYHHFLLSFKNWNILFAVFGGIVVKMDNSHLFEEVLKFLLHS